MSNTNLKTYTKKERNMYLTGLMGQNVLYNVTNVLLVSYFLQNVLYIPAIIVSVIIAVARVWDAFNDPIMGSLVDKTRTKWGKCRPYLIFVPGIVMIISILCFVNVEYVGTAGDILKGTNLVCVLWAGFSYILWGMSYTAGDIPLWGITALMTEDEKDKQKLISLARMFAGVGGGVAMLALSPCAEMMTSALKGDARTGYFLTALIATVLGAALFQCAGIGTRENIEPSEEKYSVKENFKIMWRNKPFRQILLSGLLNAPSQLMMIVAIPLVNNYYSSQNGMMSLLYLALLGGGLFIGQFVIMGLVPRMLEKTTKKKLYNGSKIVSVLPQLSLFFLFLAFPHRLAEPVFLIITMLIFAVCGVAMGLNSVLQTLMISDAVDYEEYHYGIRPDGVFFSGQTFLVKIGSGFASIIYGITCEMVNYTGDNIKKLNEFIQQGNIIRDFLDKSAANFNNEYFGYMAMLFFCISVPPAIGALLSVIPTWKYALDDDEHKKILDELNKRRRDKEETK